MSNEIDKVENNNLINTYKVAIKALALKSNTPFNNWNDGVFFSCPFHKDKTPSLSISFKKGIYKCFSCGHSGTIASLYLDITGKSLYKNYNVQYSTESLLKFDEKPIDYENYTSNIGIKIEGPLLDFKESPESVKYLRKRGISFSSAEKHKFSYIEYGKIYENTINDENLKTPFYKRLLIPIYEKGNLISVEGRDVTGKNSLKVLYPKGSSTNSLYDLDILDKNKPLYVVEGLMDLFVLREDSYLENSTCVFGACVTNRQIWLLQKFKDIIYIPDNDDAGKKAITKLKANLNTPFRILEIPFANKRLIKDVGDIVTLGETVESFRKKGWGKNLISSEDWDNWL